MQHQHVAVIPARILKRWDTIALEQLAQRALQLEDENTDLARELRWSEESACMWQDIAQAEQDGRQVGITQDCQVVTL